MPQTIDRITGKKLKGSAIDAPSLNITLGSTGVLALGTAVTAFNGTFEGIFGDNASDSLRAVVLVATIAAVAIIVAADMLARAYATGTRERLVLPWAKGWTAQVHTPGPDNTNCVVVGARASAVNPDAVEYLVVVDGGADWYPAERVTLAPPSSVKATDTSQRH